ncbi:MULTISPECIES: glycosyltransferase family 39 protein [unclassified Luteimonas]|uniref:ArnT family glycosyltransferase n=1 Tax=unclassified Luteimonas TaxID=2629088 RepID=UPI0018F05E33|nr:MULTISPECIES: glycosyltransferase family 39 protein [unclassified Luteimonas]MBJ6979587.1 glycosyltransferase family 39 protein [Luteimonas sp. MC1895]MBJ6983127.1 glycosyltransferase family 39 protein [Luteimonas sp. MC1750]QQO05166.1 glycosyltransferase family 39 protein [Luteimonas sp. MC1750]
MREKIDARAAFVALWCALLLLKAVVAARLPLFVDEAFYWQESRHLAWAYSDLPGLTAWLIRLGTTVFGEGTLALRMPFLLLASLAPWLVVRITAREFGERLGWLAGIATLLLPLSGTLGLMALPDTAMVLATLLCLDAGARLLRGVGYGAALQLALGLAIGALSHYRFAAVIGVGALALLALPQGRQALRDPRLWIAVAFGLAAWTPLLAWNFENAEAGLRFQLVDRHPWAWQADGFWFIAIQALLATPLLFVALLWSGWRGARDARDPVRYIALCGGLVVLGFFVLGFFADTERVSFHWPLPGMVALLPLLPALLLRWPRWLRVLTWASAGVGLAAVLGYYALVSVPELRARTAALKWYPSNFAGWDVLADGVREVRAGMPEGTRLVADNFKVGAELGFALDDAGIEVLEHPVNRQHGRAPQLRLWDLEATGAVDRGGPVLLVIAASEIEYKHLLLRYHALCRRFGPLPPPRVLNVDHGRTRFLLFAIEGAARDPGAACTLPALAWIDRPASGEGVGPVFGVRGWAFKDGVGVERVEVLLDGEVVAEADYGIPSPGVAHFWKISTDPGHPRVGFSAEVELPADSGGTHWLGLRLHGRDGSVEDWSEQRIEVAAPAR